MSNKQQSQSGVMKAANSAATKVSNWSPAKKNYADKVVTSGSYRSKEPRPASTKK
jgi:hypothetical protein